MSTLDRLRIKRLKDELGDYKALCQGFKNEVDDLETKLKIAENAMLATEKAMKSCRLALPSADNVMTDTAKNILGNALRELSKSIIAMGDSEIGKQNRMEQRDE